MPKKGSSKKQKTKGVIFTSKPHEVDSFSDIASEVNLSESYKSLLLGVAVVLLVTVLIFGYLKNRTPQQPPKPAEVAVSKTEVKKDILGEHTVQAGDDLKSISQIFYKTTEPYMMIAKENGITNPDIIDEGKKLIIPKIDKTTYLAPSVSKPLRKDPITDASYTVQEGDLLWDIAIRAYGDAYKWEKITTENNLPSADAIFPGMILQLSR